MSTPIERFSLTESATNAVLKIIQEKDLRHGDAMPSTGDLAQELGVSRPVIREALATLAGLGLIHRQQGRETIVTTPGSEELGTLLRLRFQVQNLPYADIQEFREFIEVDIARLAARNADKNDIANLKALLEQLKSATTEAELHDADVAFHRAIAAAGGNDILLLIIDSISPLLRKLRTRVWKGWISSGGQLQEIIEAHALILNAIEKNDESTAAIAMTDHMKQARFGLDK